MNLKMIIKGPLNAESEMVQYQQILNKNFVISAFGVGGSSSGKIVSPLKIPIILK